MANQLTITNFPNTFNQIVAILNSIYSTNSQTVSILTNFNNNPSYVFVDALRQTLHNLCDLLDASLLYQGLSITSNNLQQIEELSLNISAQDQNYLSTRSDGIGTAMAYLAGNIVAYPQPVTTLLAGNPVVSALPYLNYMSQFTAEVVPSNVIAISDIVSGSTDETAGWLRIRAAANSSGDSFEASILDSLVYMNSIQFSTTDFISSYIPLSNAFSVSAAWNYVVAAPIYQDMGNIYWDDPSNPLIENAMILRYTLKQNELLCAQLLLAFMNQVSINVQTAQLLQTQSLMDLANAAIGNYTQWEAIAQTNALLPPYLSSTPAPNLAAPGANLYLPGATPQGNPGTYNINFLGSDINWGPPGGNMPAWSGDFGTINGLNNLQYALARRLLTPSGSFIYHPTYGSLITTYLGKPLTIASISVLLGYMQAALLSDPRVATVLNLGANLLDASSIYLASTVQAAGGPTKSTTVNIVLQPSAVAQTGN